MSASSIPNSVVHAFRSLSKEMILIIMLALACCVLLTLIISLYGRLNRLMKGKNSVSIEETLIEITKELQDFAEFKKGSEEYLVTVEKRLRDSVQTIETVRFNPFKGTGAGGNQSFASAFINQNGDGLVISTLNSSDRMSIFGKPVSKFASQFDLTEEEKSVLKSAAEKLTK